MNGFSFLEAASVALVLAGAAAPATAGGGPSELVDSRLLTGVFAPDPEGMWRRIGEIDSTSTCIGDPVTPLCAIETLHACIARRISDLCRIAKGPHVGDLTDFRTIDKDSRYRIDHFRIYRVVSVRLATEDDVRGAGIAARRVGDLLVDTEWQPCWLTPTGESCLTFSGPTTHTVRRHEGRWVVVQVYSPRH